jgi:hypothetical protein
MSGPRRYRATTGAGDAREQGAQPLQAAAQSARREQPRPSHAPNHIGDTKELGKKGRGRESTSTVAGEVSGELQLTIWFFFSLCGVEREREIGLSREERGGRFLGLGRRGRFSRCGREIRGRKLEKRSPDCMAAEPSRRAAPGSRTLRAGSKPAHLAATPGKEMLGCVQKRKGAPWVGRA